MTDARQETPSRPPETTAAATHTAGPAEHGFEVLTDPGRRDDATESGRRAEATGTYQPLLSGEQGEALRSRWERIQVEFVDEPRTAVEGADGLVAELMEQLSRQFSQVRAHLEGQWNRGELVSTEELRVALQRYRSFFDRLLVA